MATVSRAAALGLVVYGLGGPLSGKLMQSFGVRPVTLASVLLSAACLVLSSMVQNQWQLFLFFGFFSGLATGLAAVFVLLACLAFLSPAFLLLAAALRYALILRAQHESS